MASNRQPVLFLSHGPGPAWLINSKSMPLLKPADKNSKSANFLRTLHQTELSKYPAPKAVLVVSAHWDEPVFKVQSVEKPELYYDYGNFPNEAFQVKWPVPGAPEVALRAQQLLEEAGIDVQVDNKRGLDHGVFVPLTLVYQNADVPVFQVSLKSSMTIPDHLALGEVLSVLRDEGVLIISSGQTTHNVSMRSGNTNTPTWVTDFQKWIHDAISNPDYSAAERKKIFLDTKEQETFIKNHPTMDLYLPIPVASAAASYMPGRVLYEEYLFGTLLVSHYLFEN